MIRNLFCIFVACAWITVLMPFVLLTMLVTWDTGSSIWIARRLWSPVLLWAGGARLEVSGQENVDPARPTIYISNHQSTIDIPTLFVAIPVNLRFVVKKELSYVPVLGWYLKLAGYVFVDRGNRGKAIASLDAAAEKIRKGTSVIVYAEGTRSDGRRVLPFKKGPFALAIKSGVPICPVAIEGSGTLMPKNRWTITPGPIKVKVGAPIDTRNYGEHERERLIRDVRDAIIRQNLELGGLGGDRDNYVAAAGTEGIGRPVEDSRKSA